MLGWIQATMQQNTNDPKIPTEDSYEKAKQMLQVLLYNKSNLIISRLFHLRETSLSVANYWNASFGK